MGRLIDADLLIEEIWKKHKETEVCHDLCVDELKDVFCGVVATIDEQPTAYNPEKVVEELEELKDAPKQSCPYNTGWKSSAECAIEIVRKGGVE